VQSPNDAYRYRLLSLDNGLQVLLISESTMRRRIRAGKIKFIKDGKDYRFEKPELIKQAA